MSYLLKGMDQTIYQSIFQNFPSPRLLLEVGPEHIIIRDANLEACTYFECKAEDLLDKMPAEAFENNVAEHIIQSCKSCIKTGKAVSINIAPNFPGGVRMQAFTLSPLPTEDKDITVIDMIAGPEEAGAQDIQRERDDAILLLTSLFDATGVGILVTDHFGRIVQVNDSFTQDYGWLSEDIINQDFVILIPPEEREISLKLHNAFIERGKSGAREIQILRKDGRLRDIYLTTVLLELSQNRRFVLSTLRDITDRKNMMRKLQYAKEQSDASNRAKSAFLANMSHELRTPLNAIIGFTEMIRNETYGPIENDKYSEYLSDIHFSARHLLEIINDVLDMSKIEAGKTDLVESDLDLEYVFKSVDMIMCERAKNAGVSLKFEVDEQARHLRADQRLLRQILINLIANSIKFSNADTQVSISAKPMVDRKYLRITVSDQGCGIPKNKIAKVMEPFGQINDPSKSRGQGTGLGLPLARAMVELHGGELLIESRKGEGTKVYLDFPVASKSDSTTSRLTTETS